MANTFKNKTFDGSSTTANSDMIPYTTPVSTTTVVIGLTIANTTNNQVQLLNIWQEIRLSCRLDIV